MQNNLPTQHLSFLWLKLKVPLHHNAARLRFHGISSDINESVLWGDCLNGKQRSRLLNFFADITYFP